MGAYSPEEILRNKRYSILHGSYSAASINIYNGFLILFALEALGASNQQVALLSSLPQLMNLVAIIPATMIMNRLASKKVFTGITTGIARLFLCLIALIPFIPVSNQAWLLVIVVALLALPNSMSVLSWQSFIADLIPGEKRANFLGQRYRMLTLVGTLILLVVGIVLNFFDKANPVPYQVFFFFAFLLGLMEVYYLSKHFEKKQEIVEKKSVGLTVLKKMLSHKNYTWFIVSVLIFHLGWLLTAPLFSIYQIQYAHATALWVSLFTVANQISQLISYPYWAKYAEKFGNTIMLFIATTGMTLAPILTILSTNLYYLMFINLCTGMFLAGTLMLLLNQLLHVSPEEGRTTFIAVYNILIGLVGFLAPQIGVWMLDAYSMNFTMIISAILRFFGALCFLFVFLGLEKKKSNHPIVKTP